MPNRVNPRAPKKSQREKAQAKRVRVEAGRHQNQKVEADQDELHLEMPVATSSRAKEFTNTEGCYVYGIASGDAAPVFGKTTIGGHVQEVFTIPHREVVAVASKVKSSIFDPTRENALAHEHVVEHVMNTHTIIPMSFGTIFRSEDDVRQVLKSIYPSLKDVLEKMEGKIELGLKVNWDREKVIERIKRENEDIRTFNSELSKKRLQSTYLARMQLGRMIEQALTERAAEIMQQIYESLRPICVASRDSKPIGDKMIMNAAFLLERTNEAEFDRIVKQISVEFKDLLTFRYSGPWPPYNFVNIRLKLDKA